MPSTSGGASRRRSRRFGNDVGDDVRVVELVGRPRSRRVAGGVGRSSVVRRCLAPSDGLGCLDRLDRRAVSAAVASVLVGWSARGAVVGARRLDGARRRRRRARRLRPRRRRRRRPASAASTDCGASASSLIAGVELRRRHHQRHRAGGRGEADVLVGAADALQLGRDVDGDEPRPLEHLQQPVAAVGELVDVLAGEVATSSSRRAPARGRRGPRSTISRPCCLAIATSASASLWASGVGGPPRPRPPGGGGWLRRVPRASPARRSPPPAP